MQSQHRKCHYPRYPIHCPFYPTIPYPLMHIHIYQSNASKIYTCKTQSQTNRNERRRKQPKELKSSSRTPRETHSHPTRQPATEEAAEDSTQRREDSESATRTNSTTDGGAWSCCCWQWRPRRNRRWWIWGAGWGQQRCLGEWGGLDGRPLCCVVLFCFV